MPLPLDAFWDMLTPKTQYSLKNAREYFAEHLSTGDYYSEGHRTHGEWIGDGAQRLNLSGHVRESDFLSLCENRHPATGTSLTQRKTLSFGGSRASQTERAAGSRRVFYDFTISAPKSVSVAALVGNDARILDAHTRAIREALSELESFASTRVRVGGNNGDRRTGNFITATFTHETSRALDPHLHTHCIVFNATFDPLENKWKALQNFEMLRAQKYVENVYYHFLARELRTLEYGVSNRRRGDFEVLGVSQSLCERFSKRHAEIDALTRALLTAHPEKTGGNIAAMREYLAHSKRSRKVRNVDSTQLQAHWTEQLTPVEVESLHALRSNPASAAIPTADTAVAALDLAEGHLFERRSVTWEHELWRYALEFGRGGSFGLDDLKAESQRRDYIRDQAQPGKFTTRQALATEQELVNFAKSGVGQWAPFAPSDKSHLGLDADQSRVVAQILSSRDFVTLFRGAAGTGKSRTLGEVFACLQKKGAGIHVLAPQRQQALDLAASGLSGATTISEFLVRKPLSAGDVIIVDEAGQIGGQMMLTLLTLAKQSDCRLIISGDTRQHGAVEASDAMRAIEQHAGLSVAELTKIRRQDPVGARNEVERAFVTGYREAVEAASRGDCARSFEKLDSLGAVVLCATGSQHEKLAAEFMRHLVENESALVVAQTWSEIHRLNNTIRTAMKKAGHLPCEERKLKSREIIDLTNAQKRDPRFYDEGTVLVFRKSVSGFNRNESARVIGFLTNSLLAQSDGRVREVPFSKLDCVALCNEREIGLSAGDCLQLRTNAKTRDGRRLTNGELVTISSIASDGTVHLQDGRVLETDFRDFVLGYAVTSYGSQGKTVDHVLFSDSAVRAATNQQQWYVTISRGRKSIRIFTEDREGLAENIQRAGARELALDLDARKPTQADLAQRQYSRGRRLWNRVRRFLGQRQSSHRIAATPERGQTL